MATKATLLETLADMPETTGDPTVLASKLTYSAPNTSWAGRFRELFVGDIAPDLNNPRKHFDEAALAELGESIKADGLLEPIVVRPNPARGSDVALFADAPRWLLVAGERRWRASRLVGLDTIAAQIREDLDDRSALRLALVENLQRQDLDPIEEAEGYAKLNRIVGLKQTQIAAAVKRSQPAIANAMRLLDLPEDVQGLIRSGALSVSHGVALAKWKGWPKLASALASLATDRNLTSKALDGDVLEDFGYRLEKADAVKMLSRYNPSFDYAVCSHCPFHAFRKGTGNWLGYCLNPEHYAELKAAAETEKRAKADEQIAAARASGGTVLELKNLRHNDYQTIWGKPPSGCTEDCPCRSTAINHGGEPTIICTDPKRHQALYASQKKAQEEQQAESFATDLNRLIATLDDKADLRRCAAVVTMAALKQAQRSGAQFDAARHAPALLNGKKLGKVTLDALAELPVPDLIRFAAEAILRTDLGTRLDWAGAKSLTVDWFLAVPEPDEAAADD